MKRPQPDICQNAKNLFVSSAGANRKLKRLWGTETVNGVEVLHARRHYHKPENRPDNYERLFKFLKVYNDVKDYDGKGIKSAWFTLNKLNSPGESEVPISFVTDNLNRMWWDPADGEMPENLTLTSTIVISDRFAQKGISINDIDFEMPKEDLIQFVEDNYDDFWRDKRIVQEGVGVINKGSTYDPTLAIDVQDEDDLSPDDPWMAILSRYVLRTHDVTCEIKDVEVGLGSEGSRVYNTLVVTLQVPYYEFSDTSSIVKRIFDDLDTSDFPRKYADSGILSRMSGFFQSNENITQALAKQVNYYELPDDIDADVVTRSYIQWEDATEYTSKYESYWVRKEDIWYLKADVIDNPKAYGTTHIELNNYLFGLLDTGYKKEKVPWWKKVVAIIVFIVAVIIAYVAPVAAGYASQVAAAAAAVLTGALVISLITLALSAIGANEWAMAFAEASKTIEPLVAVAAIIMVVNIVSTVATNIAAAGVSTVVEQTISQMAQDFVTGLTDIFQGTISDQAVGVVTKATNLYSKVQLKKLESVNDKNKDLKAEYEKLAEETAMESDIMRGYMNIYAKPATADWSMYAATYDLPYERGGGNLSLGNIQRTTKQAIRKPDYKEPMFDGIIFV